MEPISLTLAIVALGVATTGAALTLRAERKRKAKEAARDEAFTEVLKLATNVIDSATIGRSRATAIPVNSPEGRALLDLLRGGPCSCPNCEEERRIAHAEQNRDEK